MVTHGVSAHSKFYGETPGLDYRQVEEIWYDYEAAKGDLHNVCGIKVTSPGQHLPHADRAIRTLKERIRIHIFFRSPYTTLPVCGIFLHDLVMWCGECMDFCPSSNTPDAPSAYEQYYGKKLDVLTDLKAGFLDYVVANERKVDTAHSSVTNPRGLPGVVIRHVHDEQGNVTIYPLDKTKKMVNRNQVTHAQVTEEVLAQFYEIARIPGGKDNYGEEIVLTDRTHNTLNDEIAMEEQHASDEAHSKSIHTVSEGKEPQETEHAEAGTHHEGNDSSPGREKAVQNADATEPAPDRPKTNKQNHKQNEKSHKRIQWKEVQVDKPITTRTGRISRPKEHYDRHVLTTIEVSIALAKHTAVSYDKGQCG